MDKLPKEIICKILSHLDLGDLLKIRLMCRTLNEMILHFYRDLIVFRICLYYKYMKPSDVESKLNTLNEICTNSIIKGIIFSIEADFKLDKEMMLRAISNFTYVKFDNASIFADLFFDIIHKTEVKSLIINDVSLVRPDNPVPMPPPTTISLTELRLVDCFHLSDYYITLLANAFSQLQLLEVITPTFVFFPYYTRRYYRDPEDLKVCWSKPSRYGLTFTIIRALFTFCDTRIEHLIVGHNLSESTPGQVLQLKAVPHITLICNNSQQLKAFQKWHNSLTPEEKAQKQITLKCRPNPYEPEESPDQIQESQIPELENLGGIACALVGYEFMVRRAQ